MVSSVSARCGDRRHRDRIELGDLIGGQIGVMSHIAVAASTADPIVSGNRQVHHRRVDVAQLVCHQRRPVLLTGVGGLVGRATLAAWYEPRKPQGRRDIWCTRSSVGVDPARRARIVAARTTADERPSPSIASNCRGPGEVEFRVDGSRHMAAGGR